MKQLKALGQNFLTDPGIAQRIVAEAGVTAQDQVWEIGPGTGILTRALLAKGCSLTTFELDHRLEQALRQEFGSRVKLVMADILKIDWQQELDRCPQPIKLVANIPYHISSPLLHRLERYSERLASITLMLQAEVAQRICANPGHKAYGAMTLRLRRLYASRILLSVPRHCFQPVPSVDSAVVHLVRRTQEPMIADLGKYLKLLELAFAHRRKTLRNNLKSLADRDRLERLQTLSGIDLNRRGETLSESEFITLSRFL